MHLDQLLLSADVADIKIGPRSRNLPTQNRCQGERIRAGCPYDERSQINRSLPSRAFGPAERIVDHRDNRLAHVKVAGVANQADDLKAIILQSCRRGRERFSNRVLAVEVLPGERLVDDRYA